MVRPADPSGRPDRLGQPNDGPDPVWFHGDVATGNLLVRAAALGAVEEALITCAEHRV